MNVSWPEVRWQFCVSFVLVLAFAVAVKAQPKPVPNYIAEVNIFGEVTEEMAIQIAGKLAGACAADGTDPILMVIDSPGGDIAAGNTIIDAMQLCAHPVDTLDIGEAQSMAAFIFEFGHHRTIRPRAFLMFHRASLGAEGSPEQVRSRLDFWDKYIPAYEHYVADKAGISFQEYRDLTSRIWYLTADEAIKQHLADEIATH